MHAPRRLSQRVRRARRDLARNAWPAGSRRRRTLRPLSPIATAISSALGDFAGTPLGLAGADRMRGETFSGAAPG